jgi:p-hydroxybenzoate 3-monooxygenase
MLHVDPGEDAYGGELALSQLRYVVSSRAQATALAENYVGLPLERTASTLAAVEALDG